MIIWLSSHALRLMCVYARELSPLENGGILLGWRSGEDYVVVDLRGPGPRALHGRHCFIPDHAWQVNEINRAFEASCGDLDYLGDWHSHPNGIAEMSDLDSATLLRIARQVKAPLMLIVAGSGTDWSPHCWKGRLVGPPLWRRLEAMSQELKVFDPPAAWPGSRTVGSASLAICQSKTS
ncbi:Mov34/MPN/PAD-1 family protein [Bradyrhizobium sp. CCBAU 51753]|uniref:Mov34/MPN/PAD-1 family protein n=1 Tax=Bradyrhizobium sp. CCBAU 51753 TaxID=1325100 RepID=UPI00188B8A49|nr:Mov34/MPN/PAD-1 family protein [Bradyrhizobium sp. CCBAU 51753]